MNTPGLFQPQLAADADSRRYPPRWLVFLVVFLLALAIGAAVVFLRDPVYRAVVSVLTVKPKAVDAPSVEADLEHVAIQERLLLGENLLQRLEQRLRASADRPELTAPALNGMLSVAPVPLTNLLELRAEGSEPRLLQQVVNAWADAYEAFRADEIAAATGRTTAELEDEQARLIARIGQARDAVADFGENHDIVSLERDESSALAALKGMQASLAKARESEVEARANVEATEIAIARGTNVAPAEQKADLAKLRQAYEGKRDQLDQLLSRFTLEYLARDPQLRELPDEVSLLKRQLERALDQARQSVRDEARQSVDAAVEAVAALERQLEQQQADAQAFSRQYQEYQSLQAELERLDMLLTDNRERLARIEILNFKDYPPIQIVEYAQLPTRPIYPDYGRDFLMALGIALVAGIFAAWLLEYLTGRPGARNLSYIGLRIAPESGLLAAPNEVIDALPERGSPLVIDRQPQQRLVAAEASAELADIVECSDEQVSALLACADGLTASSCALLLSGLTPEEIAGLDAGCFDESRLSLAVPGQTHRVLELAPAVWHYVTYLVDQLAAGAFSPSTVQQDEGIRRAAEGAGWTDADATTGLSLWYSYVLFLVRQDIGLAGLQQRVGMLPPALRQSLKAISPSRFERGSQRISWVHPALRA